MADKKAFQRQMVEKEIIETEKQFGQDIAALQKFRKILQDKKLLPPDVIESIFLNVDALAQINGVILEQLGSKSIGEVFLAQAPFLKMFSMYCEKHEAGLATWKRFKSKKGSPLVGFDDFLSKSHKGLYLHDFLIKPVQRICKYPLLFRNLLELVPPGPYLSTLQEVDQKINLVVASINQNKAKVENRSALQHYASILADTPPGWDIYDNPDREFIKEIHGWVIVLKRIQVPTVQKFQDDQFERQFLLFNDRLIVAQKRKDKLIFKRELELQFMTIMPHEPSFKFKDVSFLLEDRRSTGDWTCLFFFAKPLERGAVFKEIKNLTTQARLGNLKKSKSAMLNHSGGNPIPSNTSPGQSPGQSPTTTGGGSEAESPTSSPHTTNPKNAAEPAADYSDHLNIDFGELGENPLCELNSNLFLPNQSQAVPLGQLSPTPGRVVIRQSGRGGARGRGGPGRGGPGVTLAPGAGRGNARMSLQSMSHYEQTYGQGGPAPNQRGRGGPNRGGGRGLRHSMPSQSVQQYEAQYEASLQQQTYEQPTANYEQAYNENNHSYEANTYNQEANAYGEANQYGETYSEYNNNNYYNENTQQYNNQHQQHHQQPHQQAYNENNSYGHEQSYGETPSSYHDPYGAENPSSYEGGYEGAMSPPASSYGETYSEYDESYVEFTGADGVSTYDPHKAQAASGAEPTTAGAAAVTDEFDAMDRDSLIAYCRRLQQENRQLTELVEQYQASYEYGNNQTTEQDWGTVSFGGHYNNNY